MINQEEKDLAKSFGLTYTEPATTEKNNITIYTPPQNATKKDLLQIAEMVAVEISENKDLLKAYADLDKIELLAGEVKKRIKPEVEILLYRNRDKKQIISNVEFAQSDIGTSYAYAECGDIYYAELCEDIAKLNEKKKEREALLKAIPDSGAELTNPNTGEVYSVTKPIKTAHQGFKATIK